MEKIGFLPRFIATLIDCFIIFVFIAIFGFIFGTSISSGLSFSGAGYFANIILNFSILAYTYLDVIKGQTLGKSVMSLKIKNVDGSEASEEVLRKRWLIKYAGSLISLIAVITTLGIFNFIAFPVGIIIFLGTFMIFSADKLTLHDKLSETSVFSDK